MSAKSPEEICILYNNQCISVMFGIVNGLVGECSFIATDRMPWSLVFSELLQAMDCKLWSIVYVFFFVS
ncbi:hypothetical protein Peur_053250 [Populus x canadensis]